jgi:hypothetical protein
MICESNKQKTTIQICVTIFGQFHTTSRMALRSSRLSLINSTTTFGKGRKRKRFNTKISISWQTGRQSRQFALKPVAF